MWFIHFVLFCFVLFFFCYQRCIQNKIKKHKMCIFFGCIFVVGKHTHTHTKKNKGCLTTCEWLFSFTICVCNVCTVCVCVCLNFFVSQFSRFFGFFFPFLCILKDIKHYDCETFFTIFFCLLLCFLMYCSANFQFFIVLQTTMLNQTKIKKKKK